MTKPSIRPWRAAAAALLLLASPWLPATLQAQTSPAAAASVAAPVLTAPKSTAPDSTVPKRTDPGAPPASVMWLGNSFFYYNNSLHNHFARLVASAGAGARVRGISVTVSGSGLDWHDMASLLRPDGLGRYSFVGDN